eukprot:TRINITY_DN1248_c0_g1_i1.p1 TRINITY_DN1248_c0_g1~~TRINITY_DN1248_c0_g1_i1.p1  ORF type:complete len:465 (-),score=41.87 TRINITY_DN1248_c0_g1_i1:22-1416(-)
MQRSSWEEIIEDSPPSSEGYDLMQQDDDQSFSQSYLATSNFSELPWLSCTTSNSTISKPINLESIFPILALPEELQFLVLLKMGLGELGKIAFACHHFKAMCSEQRLWRLLCKRFWDLSDTRSKLGIDWKRYFRVKMCLSRDSEKGDVATCIPLKCEGAPTGLYGFTGCAIGKKIHFIGGQKSSSERVSNISVFDTREETFSLFKLNVGEVPTLARHVAAIVEGKIYVFGGYNGVDTFYSLACLDLESKSWTYPKTYNTTPPLRSNGACAAVGSQIFIFGGSNNDEMGQYQIVEDFSVIDVHTMVWKTLHNCTHSVVKGEVPCGRVGHRMVALNKKLYVFGGGVWVSGRGWTQRFRDIHVFDTETYVWSILPGPSIPTDISYPFVFDIEQHIFITQLSDRTLYVFDTVAERWDTIILKGETPPDSRTMGAIAVVDNDVYILGHFHLSELFSFQDKDFHKIRLKI